MEMLRRAVVLAVLCLVPGALLTVTSAWVVVLRAGPEAPGSAPRGVAGIHAWPRKVPDHWPPPVSRTRARDGGPLWLGGVQRDVWSGIDEQIERRERDDLRDRGAQLRLARAVQTDLIRTRAGWPFLAVRHDVLEERAVTFDPRTSESDTVSTAWMPDRRWTLAFVGDGGGRYSFRPAWPGFVLNTLLFGGVVYGIRGVILFVSGRRSSFRGG